MLPLNINMPTHPIITVSEMKLKIVYPVSALYLNPNHDSDGVIL